MKLRTIVCLNLIALVAFLVPPAHAQTFSVIHAFTGVDGENPFPGVTIHGGNLYGTTPWGVGNNGGVYEISRSGSGWLINVISNLGNTGNQPHARALFGPDGHLYGTTALGGNNNNGVVFDLIPPASLCKTAKCFWSENDVYRFAGGPSDGTEPAAGDLIWDQQGNIFGVTGSGGDSGGGTVYELTPSGSGYTEKVLYGFPDLAGGAGPNGVIMDANGNLFGTTYSGGLQDCPEQQDCGVVFELTNVPGVGWQETVLYAFTNGNDGANPVGGLVLDGSGNLYGTTRAAGSGGAGVVFELSPSGNTWTYNVLYSFSGIYGCGSWASLTMDAAGNLYGTTDCTGANQAGNVFKLSKTQNGWVYRSLYDFTGGSDGAYTSSYVTIDTDGTLYGTAGYGGSFQGACVNNGCGTVWMIKP
jgi:uncharacterized repeat protein (TIGR03803 family)